MKIVVLDAGTLRIDPLVWEPLKALGKLEIHEITAYDSKVITERCSGAEIVLSNKVPLMRETLEQLDSLKLISILATGTNNVDHAAAKERGITVKNVPGYSTPAVAQHTLALLLEMTNRTGFYNSKVENGDWVTSEHFSFWNHDIPELSGRTVGIVGFGEIGRAVGQVFSALGMKVIASMRTPRNPPDWKGFAFADTETIFAEADVVTLHCPETDENRGFVNERLLSSMKKSAYLINTARGGLINQDDLRKALENGKIAGAAIDVLDAEPMRENHVLLNCPNLITTPHLAWASIEARKRLIAMTVENVKSFLSNV